MSYFFYMDVCGFVHDMAHKWNSENTLWDSVLSSHHMGPRDHTQVIKLGGKSFIHQVILMVPRYWLISTEQ